ncbi:MAG: hypothetical protein A2289_17615 [Deltaproteobacteria bacterium RIFOXYA12_FULL_58_15]|nr:MAG: hypothetical protein A2289_17615 [Deltaproteobacteria bacterium RIFOXYA12_FULL_58_15]
MTSESISVLVTFTIYLVALLAIGRLSERKHSKSYEDFVSADKSLGGVATALSAAASSESVWVMLGLSGLAYWKGMAALWAALGCLLGFAFNAVFITVQLRRDSERLKSLTISDYIEDRLGDRSKILRLVSASLITFFMVSYVVAQFTGAGQLFVGLNLPGLELGGADMRYFYGVLVGALIVGVYISFGGYAAVCWTDTLQGTLMFVVMLSLPILALVKAGGPSGVAETLEPLGLLSISGAETAGWAAAGFIIGQLGIGLGYPGMPHMLVRYITVVNDVEAKRSAWISVVWSLVVLFGSAILGIATRALYPHLAESQKLAEALVLPHFCHEHLHPIFTGVVISSVTAAIMSTADSQLMYAATSFINDFWLKLTGGTTAMVSRLVALTRLAVIVMTLIAMAVAFAEVRLIYTFVLLAWGALGAAFAPIIILSLYWKRLTRWGALASLITGPAVVLIWHNVDILQRNLYELVPAFVVSFIATVVVSLVTWESEKGNVNTGG